MPLPIPKPGENSNDFVSRCMINPTMTSEYPKEDQRYAICTTLSENKGILNKKKKRKLSSQYIKQLKLAEKQNYPVAYRFYMDNYNKGIEMYSQEETANNPNFSSLFKEKDLKTMYTIIYKQTGLRFYRWYKKNFAMFQKQESFNEESAVAENLERFAKEKEGYLALAKEVSAVSGVARGELDKIIRQYMADPEFMTYGIENRTRILTKALSFKARWMAKRIVRTESTAAANLGIIQSAENIFGRDELVKEWIATFGTRGRPAHQAYSGTVTPLNDPYEINGSQMQFPGDTNLSASANEIVNCRCFSAPFVSTEAMERQEQIVRNT